MWFRFRMMILVFAISTGRYRMALADSNTDSGNKYALDSVREALIRQEDTIIFSLIERAKFPINCPTYDKSYASNFNSLVEFIVKNTESIQAKAGRYKNPEENPFFPEDLPSSVAPNYPFPQILHPAAALININKSIWKMYFDELLPKLVASGDDGNYAQTAACDLSSLQAISRRIHYGKYVAEVKFRGSPQDYEPLIRAQFLQDREALMNLLTFETVEETVRKRVEKKARVFGQEVGPDHEENQGKYKVDPSVVSLLYEKWVIPLTKLVQVEYLLRRLD
ncbi:chorismate mutase 2 isoform X1 [Prosopis cineraria]|uniref:chorismate mutase 2 isoform X1 n=2 Tax=Prosopis cineraria TaxID=364024 RepID=UPI00240F0121|nr:chorismate mutase 2 isoform X1 [Prosopis cineraria]